MGSEYRPGAYLSGQQVPDGTGQDGKVIYTTTAADVRERVAEAARHGAKLKEVALWVYEDACPPAPGCVVAGAPKLDDSGTLGTVAWQYAQSPRRPAVTTGCAVTYGADGMCYGGATKDISCGFECWRGVRILQRGGSVSAGIYVERVVRGSLDEVWRRTQVPAVHQRWDLRFTTIEYLARVDGEPQRFLYETRGAAWDCGAGDGGDAGRAECGGRECDFGAGVLRRRRAGR